MTNDKDGGPAFPGTWGQFNEVCGEIGAVGGMTLRDYFAGQALAGLFANKDAFDNNSDSAMSDYAYSVADAMLKARKEGSDGQ